MIELLRRFARPYRRYFVLGPLSKLVEVFFDLLTPLVVAAMIDQGVGGRDADAVTGFGLVLAVMALAGFVSTFVCQKMAALASQGLGTAIRDALFAHVNALSHAELDRFGTPSLITRITSDVNQVQLAVALGIRQLARFPLLAAGSVIAALAIDLKLGMIFLVSIPLIGLIFWVVMARCVPYFKAMQGKLDRVGLLTREGLSGVRVVRAFTREADERERFADAARDQAATAIAVGRLSSLLNPATFLIMNLAVCAILWNGGIAVNVGELTQGQVVAFVNYMTQALLAIVYVANLVAVCTKGSASAARIVEVLDCAPSIADEGNAPVDMAALARLDVAREGVPSNTLPPAIRMAGVSFAFPGSALSALEDITFELPVGGTLGVIGGTGSGKSTLVSLLLRLYDAASGSVAVLGRDVRAWPLRQLRREVALVPQKAELVSGTIRSNLQWRDAAATDDEIWWALRTAQAAAFVEALPDGLDARVEAGGRNFSGGQRQRLTIARSLVGEPSLLILDDSASALDFKTDAALRAAIRRMASERAGGVAGDGAPATPAAPDAPTPRLPLSAVIVSQRVSAVRDADLICVMRRGRIVGLGAHEELLSSCEVYREICASQLGGDRAPVGVGERGEVTCRG